MTLEARNIPILYSNVYIKCINRRMPKCNSALQTEKRPVLYLLVESLPEACRSANGCLVIEAFRTDSPSCWKFLNLSSRTERGCVSIEVRCRISSSQLVFRTRSTSFLELRVISLNSGAPSRRNSRSAFVLSKLNILVLFL